MVNKFLKQKNAFTLAEALMILLVTSLIATAMVPVITKKHSTVSNHGKWYCTMDSAGNHYVKTVYKGKDSGYKKAANNSCIFTPPADAKYITIKAVAGGGGGGGGVQGNETVLFDSRSSGDEVFATAVKKDSYYSIAAVGGGGGGGGMACGEAKNYVVDLRNPSSFDESKGQLYNQYTSGNRNFWNESKQDYTKPLSQILKDLEKNVKPTNYADPMWNENITYKYGYVDRPVTGFNYEYLNQNDEIYTNKRSNTKIRYTDAKYQEKEKVTIYDFKKHYLQKSYGKNVLCFAEKDWPFSKQYGSNTSNTNNIPANFIGLYLQNDQKNSIPEANSKGGLVCWNLPAETGSGGSSISKTNVPLKAGQNIYVKVGRGGAGPASTTEKTSVTVYSEGTMKTLEGYVGLPGEDGTDTIINFGEDTHIAYGGSGGYGRQLENVAYKNIPVLECEIKPKYNSKDKYTGCSPKSYTDDPTGSVASSCDNIRVNGTYPCYSHTRYKFVRCTGSNSACSSYGSYSCEKTHTDSDGNEYSCTAETKPQTICDSHPYQNLYFDYDGCRLVVRATYFNGTAGKQVKACVNSSHYASSDINYLMKADVGGGGSYGYTGSIRYGFEDFIPLVSSSLTYTDSDEEGTEVQKGVSITTMDGNGSGGQGVGEVSKTYLSYAGLKDGKKSYILSLDGYDGGDGYAMISQASYTAGGGGQAGQYISTMLKKVGKLEVKIGEGGAPGQKGGLPGGQGGNTVIKDASGNVLFTLYGGAGGLGNSTEATYLGGKVSGVNGALSPMESQYNKAKIVPLGGYSGSNTDITGYSPATEKWKTKPTLSGLYTNITKYLFLGGHPLETTFGAGGGGGGGSSSEAGYGGAGAPGAVIIEW